MIDFFLEFFVKSSVILTIVILLTYVRHFSAAERHILAFSGLCSLLVLLAFDGFYDWRIADLEGLNLSRSMADVGKEVILRQLRHPWPTRQRKSTRWVITRSG